MNTPDVRRSQERALCRIARLAVAVALALFVLALAASPAHAADPQPSEPDTEIAVTDVPAAPDQDEPETEGEPADPPPSDPDPDPEGEGDPRASEPDTDAPAPDVAVGGIAASVGECTGGIARVEIRATITGAPGTPVTYRWLRSDGATDADPQTVTLPASGTTTVTTTWDRGEGTAWQALQVTGPVAITSQRAEFTVRCEQEQPVRITDVVASAGECVDGTGRVEFRATITGAPGTSVTYRWLRSDGATDTNPQTVTLPASGTTTVTTTWDRGEGSGWQALQVTSPVELTSERAEFTLVACDRRPDVDGSDIDIDVHTDIHTGTYGWKIPVGAPQTGGGKPQDGSVGLPLAALVAVSAAAILAGRVRIEER
jgi:hypothetical protein